MDWCQRMYWNWYIHTYWEHHRKALFKNPLLIYMKCYLSSSMQNEGQFRATSTSRLVQVIAYIQVAPDSKIAGFDLNWDE